GGLGQQPDGPAGGSLAGRQDDADLPPGVAVRPAGARAPARPLARGDDTGDRRAGLTHPTRQPVPGRATRPRDWAARLGGATGRRDWAARLGGATGRRDWAARLGGATGRRGWAARLGGAAGRRGWAARLGGAARRRGQGWLLAARSRASSSAICRATGTRRGGGQAGGVASTPPGRISRQVKYSHASRAITPKVIHCSAYDRNGPASSSGSGSGDSAPGLPASSCT